MNPIGMYLQSTDTIDSDSGIIKSKATALTRECKSKFEKSRELFYFTRDTIRYNPYASIQPLKASYVLQKGDGFCVQKAVVLVALARAAGIPARLGFVDIRNHRLDPDWQKIFRTDVIVFHGFTELQIDGKWLKATPAFDLRMCEENGFIPVEFDGLQPSMLHSHDKSGKPHIDYLDDRGIYDDVPVEEIVQTVTAAYGIEFLQCWESGMWDYFLER